MCAITRDSLTNTTPCAVLRTSYASYCSTNHMGFPCVAGLYTHTAVFYFSGLVVTMDCVEKILRKDMIDPTNGKQLTEADIIQLQRGGTGFAATNEQLTGKLLRPMMELQ